MIITPVVTETRGPKTQDIYKRTEAHHPEPAHALSMQCTNASTNITPPPHGYTQQIHLSPHTTTGCLETIHHQSKKEAPQVWVYVPNKLEDIIGERCTDGKYIICIYCNEFYPQGGKVKCSHQR